MGLLGWDTGLFGKIVGPFERPGALLIGCRAI